MVAGGLVKDALYVVRPDGYVALAAASDAPATLRAYQKELSLTFGEVARPRRTRQGHR